MAFWRLNAIAMLLLLLLCRAWATSSSMIYATLISSCT